MDDILLGGGRITDGESVPEGDRDPLCLLGPAGSGHRADGGRIDGVNVRANVLAV